MWRRLRYRFDTAVARRPRILLAWHFGASAVLLFVLAFLAWAFKLLDTDDRGFLWTLLFNTVIALDPGTAANVDKGAVGQLATALLVAVLGILIVGSLIALIHNAIEHRLDYLRKGTSEVLEEDHIVILGWSQQVLPIIENLVELRCARAIAVLADRDRVEMEDEFNLHFGKRKLPHVVFRTGDPVESKCVDVVRPGMANAIIVLSPDVAHPDAHVVKILLALESDLKRETASGEESTRPTIVAQLTLARNLAVAKYAAPRAKFVLGSHVIARMLAQACTQPGLTSVFNELLTDAGNEFYFKPVEGMAGESFGAARRHFSAASLIGIERRSGDVELNPPDDAPVDTGDSFVLLAAEESDIVAAAGPSERDIATLFKQTDRVPRPTSTLVLGFSHKVRRMIKELDAYVAPGSTVLVVGRCEKFEAEQVKLRPRLKNLTVTTKTGDATDLHLLNEIRVPSFDHVVIIACADDYEIQYADARTIITLLHLRAIAREQKATFTILSEMLDSRNSELARMANSEDFIVDNALVSRLIAQYALRPRVEPVYLDLLTASGNEIYMRPASDYLDADRPLPFNVVVESARSRNELPIGYRRRESRPTGDEWTTILNPPDTIEVRSVDELIVLAEE
jgi:ion channel POLLUX/CASTOR